MAGIGFELRKLLAKDDLLGVAQGYAHSAVAAAGPWLVTAATLAAINVVTYGRVSFEDLSSFRLIVMYNFAFSLILTGPVVAVATRFLADALFARDVRGAPGLLLGALGFSFSIQLLFAFPFTVFILQADAVTRLLTLSNYFLTAGVWIAAVFTTALKEHRAVTGAFGVGMTAGLAGIAIFGPYFRVPGMLIGINLGLMIVFFMLAARVFAEYRHEVVSPFEFVGWFRRHPELAAGAVLYNVAVWVDKWIFWMSPNRQVVANGLVSYPDYDAAMFFAYLTIVPSMALFVFHVETGFFERYLAYTQSVLEHGTWARIQERQREIITEVWNAGRTILLTQAGVAAVVILLAPRLFETLHIGYTQYGMFRMGTLGAIFHVLFLFLTILLAYFELHRPVLALQALFLVLNAGGAMITLRLGFAYYGAGYFLASLIAFLAAFLVVARSLTDLPYVSFIAANPSVRRA